MFSRGGLAAVCLVIISAAATRLAQAGDRPRASYRWADPARVTVAEPLRHSSNVIFLDRCRGGCVVQPGPEDSRKSTSSIVSRTATIGEFAHGDDAWSAVVDCVRAMYRPFGVEVTDVDPGDAPHFRAIVAGDPADIGETGVGGLAPFACGVIDNAITYSFANVYGSVQDICETVTQETGHAFGLEHEVLCDDPMTYLESCGPRAFRDIDAPCGELEPRACQCGGGATQNSYRVLMHEFAGPPGPQDADSPDQADVLPSAGCQLSGRAPGGLLALVLLAALLQLRRRRA